MMINVFYLGIVGVLVGLFTFLSHRQHLLSMLLSLEYTSLSLFFVFAFCLYLYFGEEYLLLYYLLMAVCEGVLGLGVVVGVVRLSGNDFFSSFSLLKC
uniref:NADH-ubiquinone oxidoreductase chain 4L n=1 Tax=Nothopuga sp. 1 LP-2008 TaxID=504482 RepID=A9LI70_9ARAC|nr:NADH dehydrogenase subunit 4L [Nothopuga sp. 1 LP-2008]ABS71899.1 NADH dehydrogenase subunit 4L [Nothopuga sp. 1 LP-2008]